MRLSDISDRASDAARALGAMVDDLSTPTLRLGVTGLARSGKTILTSALARCLVEGGAEPALRIAGVPGFHAYLEPQPDDDVPRFALEEHLARLGGDPPRWPDSTRQISQLRVTLEWEARDWARRAVGVGRRLHVDIVDYPGEWLLDLALMGQSYDAWSKEALALAGRPSRRAIAREWLEYARSAAARAGAGEAEALAGARLFTHYLHRLRDAEGGVVLTGPGRFILPGDMEGSPLLTFFPLPAPPAGRPGELHQLMERRYESYKRKVAAPFFTRHFSRIDRQVVLIDVLAALDRGPESLNDLETTLTTILQAFRPGANSWLTPLRGRRVERVLFAATKADHLNASGHDRLQAILAALVRRAERRASVAGAETEVLAIAALQATQNVARRQAKGLLPCLKGTPVAGQIIDGRTFDGRTPAVLFPGDLPADPLDAFDADRAPSRQLSFLRFAPPRIPQSAGAEPGPWPHIGLDAATGFLLGDRLT